MKNLIKREYLHYLAHVESAGTRAMQGYPAAELAILVCKEYGIDISLHQSRPIAMEMVKSADLILCMGLNNKTDLIERYPGFEDKIFLIRQFGTHDSKKFHTIEDPYGGPKEYYEKAFLEIREEIFRIWPVVTREIEDKWTQENTMKRR